MNSLVPTTELSIETLNITFMLHKWKRITVEKVVFESWMQKELSYWNAQVAGITEIRNIRSRYR